MLGLVAETDGPAPEEVRRVLGVGTYLYHLVVEPGSQLTPHHATHAGTGLANAHATAARELETIRAHATGRQELADELAGATTAGLVRAQALLARELAPGDPAVAAATDPAAIRAALVKALRHRRHPRAGVPSRSGAPEPGGSGWSHAQAEGSGPGASRPGGGAGPRGAGGAPCRRCRTRRGCSRSSGPAEGSLGVTELARRLGLGKSTVHRLLATLTAERILEHDPATGTYRLGLMMWELGARVSVHRVLHDAAATGASRSSATRTKETVQLAVLDGREVVYVERLESPHTLRIFGRVGHRNSAHCTSTGKVLLAHLPERRLAALLDGLAARAQDRRHRLRPRTAPGRA